MNKLALVIESGGPGGAEVVVLKLAREFKRRGVEVVVITFRTGWLTEQLKAAGIEHQLASTKSGLDLLLPWRLARLFKQLKVTQIHAHLLDSYFYAGLAARISGISFLGTEHGDVHHTTPRKFIRAKLFLLALCRLRLNTVSEFTRDKLVELGYPKELVTVVSNPVEVLAEEERKIARKKIRAEWGVADSQFVWLHIGSFLPVKGQRILLDAFSNIPDGSLLMIIGKGPLESELRSRVDELGLSKRVRFLGTVPSALPYCAAADGFVLSSISESMPMVLLEAGGAGLRVAATRVGGVPELIVEGETGSLADANDAESLAEAMTRARQQGSSVAGRLKEKVLSSSTMSRVVVRYLEMYRGLQSP